MDRIRINELNMNYISSGTGFPILFVHGYEDSSNVWMTEVSFFSTEYRAIAVELRGHGRSDAPKEGYSISQLSEDVYHFLQKMKISEIVLVGHSMGGMIAQQLCIAHPESVQALVLCSTAASGRAIKEAGGFDCMAGLKEITELGLEQSIRNSVDYLFAKGTDPQIISSTISDELKTSMNAALGCLKGIWEFNLQDKLSKIRVPTLIVHGDEDRLIPLQCLEDLKKSIADSKINVVNRCGHMIPVERPQELNSSVQTFINSISLTR